MERVLSRWYDEPDTETQRGQGLDKLSLPHIILKIGWKTRIHRRKLMVKHLTLLQSRYHLFGADHDAPGNTAGLLVLRTCGAFFLALWCALE